MDAHWGVLIRVSAGTAALVGLALLGSACTSEAPTSDDTSSAWQRLHAFDPSILARDVEACEDGWLVAGAVTDESGGTTPAAFRGTGSTWRSVGFRSEDLYARTGIVQSAACRGDDLVALSAKSGGAHGLPRIRVWAPGPDGALHDVPVSFELFGGPRAVSVGRLAPGRHGFAVAGTRTTGAAVWTTGRGRAYRLVDSPAALQGRGHVHRSATDVVAHDDGWLVVGATTSPDDGLPRAAAWSSPDGVTWSREDVRTEGFGMLQVVTASRDDVWAAGLHGDGVGVWKRDDVGGWRLVSDLDALHADATGAAYVTGLAVHGDTSYVSFSDGQDFQVWSTRDAGDDAPTWSRTRLPEAISVTGDHQVQVVSGAGGVLLLADGDEEPATYVPRT